MNKVFKVIWSKAKNCYVVASELAKSYTKSPKSGVMSRALVAGVLACVLSCGAVMPAYASYSADGTIALPATSNANDTYPLTISSSVAPTSMLVYKDADMVEVPIDFVFPDFTVEDFLSSKTLRDLVNNIFLHNQNPIDVGLFQTNNSDEITLFTSPNGTGFVPINGFLTRSGTIIDLCNDIRAPKITLKRAVDNTTGLGYWYISSITPFDTNNSANVFLPSGTASNFTVLYGIENGVATVLNEVPKVSVDSKSISGTGDLVARSITASNSTISTNSITTTEGGIDATTSDVTATESVESAGPVKVKSLNAPRLTAGSGASSIGGALTVAGKISGVTAGTANTDAVNYSQLKPAIKALSVSGKTITYTKIDGTTGTITTQDTDTHYTTHLYAGSGTAANANTTNGNTKLTLADNSTVRESITIKGTGATTVTSSGGVITINSTDNNTTYSAMTGATASAAGTAGLVPAPAAGKQTAFLRGDGTWVVPTDTNTHYTTHLYVGSGTAANAATSNGSTKIALTDDSTVRNTLTIKGTGATTVTSDANGVITINSTDNNTTYSAATQSANGLMTAADKKKLDGIASGANAYTLPAATSSALGGVKIGSNITNTDGTISLTKANVTAALGYTPPTTDTNTTYDNMSATELSTGTATTARSISAKTIADYVTGKVSAETTARTSAVSSEATTRANADTALGTRIDGTIKDLSVSGRTITYTKGDGTTGTITTQDTNTTYSAFTGATSSAAGTAGLVKAPAAGDQNKFLRGDGTWAADNNTTYSAGAGLSLSGTTFSVNTNGSIASGNTGVLNGGTVYSEVRPTADGTFAKKANTTAANITALDTAAKSDHYLYER